MVLSARHHVIYRNERDESVKNAASICEWDDALNFTSPYFVLLLYPLMTYLIGDPSTMSWGANYPGTAMPPEDESQSQRNGRLILIFRYLLLTAYVFYVVHRTAMPYSAVGIYPSRAVPLIIVGIVTGMLFLSIRILATSLWPELGWSNSGHPMVNGPAAIWVVIVCVGGFSEELWRGFCLVQLQNDGLPVGAAIFATAVVFAISQLGGKPSLISGRSVEVCSTVALGIGLAILFLRFNSILLVSAANITYYLAALYMFRNKTSSTSETLDPPSEVPENVARPVSSLSLPHDRKYRPRGRGAYGRSCPICSKPVELGLISYSNPFRCQNCDAMLCIPRFYALLIHGASITTVTIVLWSFLHLVFWLAPVGGLVFALPVQAAARSLLKPIVPLEASDVVG